MPHEGGEDEDEDEEGKGLAAWVPSLSLALIPPKPPAVFHLHLLHCVLFTCLLALLSGRGVSPVLDWRQIVVKAFSLSCPPPTPMGRD